MLGFCCCMQAFSSCDEQGLLFFVVRQLLIVLTSFVAEHRYTAFSSWGIWARLMGSRPLAQQLCLGLVPPWRVASSLTRDQTCVPCAGRHSQPLDHQGRPKHFLCVQRACLSSSGQDVGPMYPLFHCLGVCLILLHDSVAKQACLVLWLSTPTFLSNHQLTGVSPYFFFTYNSLVGLTI